ncbi:MAG: redoxin domain-containing protein [Acidimicrobiia bacterium]|nr:redoxin domain-containing protein [Acidimicrobiia bacterium]
MPTDTLTIGDQIPDFRAPTSHGQTLDPDAFVGKLPLVLVFPPEDGSGLETLGEFDRRLVEFGHRRVQLLGVLTGTAGMVRTFALEYPLHALTLLADGDGSIRTAFGPSAEGSCFVTDLESRLRAVVPYGHEAVDELLRMTSSDE